jgi:hypothetical protein
VMQANSRHPESAWPLRCVLTYRGWQQYGAFADCAARA